MRKIISKHKEDKKKKIKQFVVGGILIFVMLMSTIGYSFQGGQEDDNTSQKVSYNGFDFIENNGFWSLEVGQMQFLFSYNPIQVENSSLDIAEDSNIKSFNNYYNKPLYISSENQEANFEISVNFEKIAQRIQPACLEGEKCLDKDLPIKTCSDNIIIIKENSTSSITQDNNCVFITGQQKDLVIIVDDFLFKTLGIN